MRLDSPVGKVVQKLAGSPTFAKIAPYFVPPLDRFLSRVSKGRLMLSDSLVPGIVLVTVGAKTGLERETPLAAVPMDGGFLVVGSNYGKPNHPAWTANLLKHPQAKVRHKGSEVAMTARLLSPEEKAEVWPRMIKVWPPYAGYEERAHRDLRVFRLEPER